MIFIVGYSRSGTKMMNKVLAELGVGQFIPEIHFFEQIYNFGEDKSFRNEELSKNKRIDLAQHLIQIVERVGGGFDDGRSVGQLTSEFLKQVETMESANSIQIYKLLLKMLSHPFAIDPTPRNSYYMEEILSEIPEARFIYMVRDPRDCILSQRNKWKNYFHNKKRYYEALRLWVNYNPLLMSKFWSSSISRLEKTRAQLKGKLIEVKYENFTEQPENTVRKIEELIDFKVKESDYKFIKKGNTQKWKLALSKAHAYIIQGQVSEYLDLYGYEKVNYSVLTKNIAFILYMYYIAKLPLAFILNFSRVGNVVETIKNRLLR